MSQQNIAMQIDWLFDIYDSAEDLAEAESALTLAGYDMGQIWCFYSMYQEACKDHESVEAQRDSFVSRLRDFAAKVEGALRITETQGTVQ